MECPSSHLRELPNKQHVRGWMELRIHDHIKWRLADIVVEAMQFKFKIQVQASSPYIPYMFAHLFGYDQLYVGDINPHLHYEGGLVDGARGWFWTYAGCTNARFELPLQSSCLAEHGRRSRVSPRPSRQRGRQAVEEWFEDVLAEDTKDLHVGLSKVGTIEVHALPPFTQLEPTGEQRVFDEMARVGARLEQVRGAVAGHTGMLAFAPRCLFPSKRQRETEAGSSGGEAIKKLRRLSPDTCSGAPCGGSNRFNDRIEGMAEEVIPISFAEEEGNEVEEDFDDPGKSDVEIRRPADVDLLVVTFTAVAADTSSIFAVDLTFKANGKEDPPSKADWSTREEDEGEEEGDEGDDASTHDGGSDSGGNIRSTGRHFVVSDFISPRTTFDNSTIKGARTATRIIYSPSPPRDVGWRLEGKSFEYRREMSSQYPGFDR
uniref:Uncharacterized protein n=1 Tax=Asparagus officinalis TaxID=4686 RepID=Q2A9Z3_ASPOF|nr:hypothetical protein 20.t00015 [Asparagus officinalis]